MVKLGKLTHDDFTVEELNALIQPALPTTVDLDIPIGTATVTVESGTISLREETNSIFFQAFTSMQVAVANSVIYRAHVVVTLSATPTYNVDDKCVSLTHTAVESIQLVNDDYALIKDTRFLLSKLVPGRLDSIIGQSLKTALSLVTAGTSDTAANYLSLYLSGSTHAILNYHKPQITQAILREIDKLPLFHTMRDDVWREALFARYGKQVGVAENRLRFYLV
jgi:hypothetical protein